VITHVAIRRHTGEVFSLPPPNRHHDVIRLINERQVEGDDQGFLRHDNVFLRRRAALVEAQKCGQLLPRGTHPGGYLYSEDMW
jgi:hypothetical protein